MKDIFMICAVGGGTLFLLQMALSLLGIGAEHEIDGDHSIGHDGHSDHGAGFLGVLSFRSIVAAITCFGLVGLTALNNALAGGLAVAIATGSGLAAMVLVALIMRGLSRLSADGTVRIQQALGTLGVVYLAIPARREGMGKVTVTLQNRTMEYPAVTCGEALPTGAKVLIVDLVGTSTLEVSAHTELAGASSTEAIASAANSATQTQRGNIHA
ncbi:MAG TPA: hypothetical protein VEJ63_09520 [Planctomycetota bacterium]|nr:hypothetical protein [Planctomycetota bacterium]